MEINYQKHIWEGWTVQDFINDVQPIVRLIMEGKGIVKPFKTKQELSTWLKNNQNSYKKPIPEVVKHFSNIYNL